MSTMRTLLPAAFSCAALACGALGAVAAPAGAVVGGEPVAASSVPWFASVGSCGAMLVAPDRLLTAGHCVKGAAATDLRGAVVGEATYGVRGVSMHPRWRRANGDNVLDDIALVHLASPVAGVTPVALGGAAGGKLRILGRGRPYAPGTAPSEAESFDSSLRSAVLRRMSDRACAAKFRRTRGNGGERFDASRMVCAIDVDGRAPLSSGCNGDSGGPLVADMLTAPVVLGVVSFGGARCGADRLPSVFTDVARYRAFIADPSPVLAPWTRTPATVTGSPRRGGRLVCDVTGFASAPDRVDIRWQRQGGRRAATAGRGRVLRVRRADEGHTLVCSARASNAGGLASVPFTPAASSVKVARP